MARMTRARMNREADYLEKVAAPRLDAAAADGKRVAADPSRGEYTRSCAGRAAEIAQEHAAEFRNAAQTLREGELPEGWIFD
ncbi:hypothetical protein [Streptomyces sp. 8L]|uniref:hypothetical protein n=1 Tax=Streptomyces sp. 8L TaxID=2877242 RepID=UPI001CD3B9D6|nr:hypothetical protein [Streptomyces sp. 8L]MCA1219268.1 hypothetical protein [Streptomyces sp. 8L]